MITEEYDVEYYTEPFFTIDRKIGVFSNETYFIATVNLTFKWDKHGECNISIDDKEKFTEIELKAINLFIKENFKRISEKAEKDFYDY